MKLFWSKVNIKPLTGSSVMVYALRQSCIGFTSLNKNSSSDRQGEKLLLVCLPG